MARHDNLYSKFIAWMKIILPLGALALLSTMFLISRRFDPSTAIPFARIDLQQRAQDLGVTNPTFAGVTENGTEITFKARRARPDPKDMAHFLADDVSLQMRLNSGMIIDITADNADMHQTNLTANLGGNVRMITSNGYDITTEVLLSRFDRFYAEAPGPVTGTGPTGNFKAGGMRLTRDKASGQIDLLFTGGVRLLYKPYRTKE